MIQDLQRITQLISGGWSGLHILVVGDVMLDKYVWGNVTRVSPEAPVPVITATHQTMELGGAANVAANLTGLGVQATLVGFVGSDQDGEYLQELLEKAAVRARLIETPGLPTTSKTRMMGGHQQMLRLDIESCEPRASSAYDVSLATFNSLADEADAILLSDYAKGVLIPHVCRHIIDQARLRHIPVFVGPKGRDFGPYAGATAICSNLQELAVAMDQPANDVDALFSKAQKRIESLRLEYLIVTMGEQGIAVLQSGSLRHIPARARKVFDVSGAGDTVLATITASVLAGLDIQTASELANAAAGVVIGKVGTSPVNRYELLGQLCVGECLPIGDKILDRRELLVQATAWRANGDTIVLTNGCFDLLHVGHLAVLQAAQREGTRLVVAINSDDSVRRLKGPCRPVVAQMERARLLAAMSAVDAVTIFDEDTPLECILQLRPDVLVKGGDYTQCEIVGQREVRSWNGRVKIVPTVQGVSTTNLIAQMTSSVT